MNLYFHTFILNIILYKLLPLLNTYSEIKSTSIELVKNKIKIIKMRCYKKHLRLEV